MKHEDHLILGIYEALEALGDALPAPHMADMDDFLKRIEPLTDAVKREEWNLIAEAANMRAEEPSAETRVDLFIRQIAWDIYRHPQKFGIVGIASKADILGVLEVQYPYFFVRLPTSKRGLTEWWKKVGCPANQARGYSRRSSNNP